MNSKTKLSINNLTVKNAKTNQLLLNNITLDIPEYQITAIIGPSGSGKTTLLKCINRMIDFEQDLTVQGSITCDGLEVLSSQNNVYEIRKKLAQIFDVPVPLPKTIYKNIATACSLRGITDKKMIHGQVEQSLKDAALWDEVKDRLDTFAFRLSGGQQQRLCIARTLALDAEVIMFDESTSGLDPISTSKIEDTVFLLKNKATILWVTNNVKQAARISDVTAFVLMGELIEWGPTEQLFTRPQYNKTEEYITGKFG